MGGWVVARIHLMRSGAHRFLTLAGGAGEFACGLFVDEASLAHLNLADDRE
jgi:hypothetical protein